MTRRILSLVLAFELLVAGAPVIVGSVSLGQLAQADPMNNPPPPVPPLPPSPCPGGGAPPSD
jgi:hypothetical protein